MSSKSRSVRASNVKETLSNLARSEIVKAVVAGIVVAAGGYFAALVISPDQLYRRIFNPNPDNYLGDWNGVLGGRPVALNIHEQIIIPNSNAFIVKGTLGFVGSAVKINIEGKADSSFIISGRVDKGDLNIELEREDPKIRTPNERYVRMLPPKGSTGARICPPSTDITSIASIDQCPTLPGNTMFFR